MKKRIGIVILTVLLQWYVGTAQKTEGKPGLRFQSINQAGILIGHAENALQLQTVNGLTRKTWFAGLGVGLDYYHVRSIPVFLDVRKMILNKQKSPFVYADGGYNFPFLSKRNTSESLWIGDYNKGGGLYYEAGFGYKVDVSKKMQLLFSAGYSYKRLAQTVNVMPWLSIWPPPKEAYEVYEHTLRRVAMKVGIGF